MFRTLQGKCRAPDALHNRLQCVGSSSIKPLALFSHLTGADDSQHIASFGLHQPCAQHPLRVAQHSMFSRLHQVGNRWLNRKRLKARSNGLHSNRLNIRQIAFLLVNRQRHDHRIRTLAPPDPLAIAVSSADHLPAAPPESAGCHQRPRTR